MDGKNTPDNSPYSRLNNDLQALNTFIEHFTEKHKITLEESFELLKNLNEKSEKSVLIPSSILKEKNLGILESIIKHLKEDFNFNYHQISILLERDERAIWVAYNKASKKNQGKLIVSEPNYWLPIFLFRNDALGPLESISIYLHDTGNLAFNQIAKLLDRDNRTIWACYHNGKKKLQTKNEQ